MAAAKILLGRTLSTLPDTPPTAAVVTSESAPHGPFAAMRRMLPPGQVVRVLVAFYSHILPHRFILFTANFASVTSKPISITVAFLCYKHFVFRTKGNYIREWIKCFAVYGVGTIPEQVALPLVTKFFLLVPLGFLAPLFDRLHIAHPAPVLAILCVAVFTAIYSYFAHKKFSFKQ